MLPVSVYIGASLKCLDPGPGLTHLFFQHPAQYPARGKHADSALLPLGLGAPAHTWAHPGVPMSMEGSLKADGPRTV